MSYIKFNFYEFNLKNYFKKFKFFYFFLLIKYRYCIFQNGIGMVIIALK